MKDLLQICLFCLSFFWIFGCSDKGNYYNPKEFYSLKDTLKGEILSEPIESRSGSVRLYYTGYGLLACTKLDNKIFQLLDSTNAKLITATGRRGRGPDEFLMAQGMQYEYAENRFSVFDMYRQELVTYKVSPDTISLLKSANLKRDLQNVKYLNDSLLAFVNFYPDQKIGLMNTCAEVICEEDYNPLEDSRIKTIHAYHSVKLDVSPDKKYTVAIETRFPSIKVYKNKPDGLELKWEKILFEPMYNFRTEKNWYILHDNHYSGFRSLYLTHDYIYLSCDDVRYIDIKEERPAPEHTYLLVMDYDGNIVNKYLLDNFFVPFTISPDGKSLYAVIYDPDLSVAKYKLP